jgi:hypothetical protein
LSKPARGLDIVNKPERGGIVESTDTSSAGRLGGSTWARAKLGLAIAFSAFHVATSVVMGTSKETRARFEPYVGGYRDALRMTAKWGMFSKAPTTRHIRVEAVDDEGHTWVLATTEAQDKPVLERLRDVRVRKLLTNAASKKKLKKLGAAVLDGYCRSAAQDHLDVARVRLTRARSGKSPQRYEVLLQRTCRKDRPAHRPPEAAVANANVGRGSEAP